jgi:hypothetical protein
MIYGYGVFRNYQQNGSIFGLPVAPPIQTFCNYSNSCNSTGINSYRRFYDCAQTNGEYLYIFRHVISSAIQTSPPPFFTCSYFPQSTYSLEILKYKITMLGIQLGNVVNLNSTTNTTQTCNGQLITGIESSKTFTYDVVQNFQIIGGGYNQPIINPQKILKCIGNYNDNLMMFVSLRPNNNNCSIYENFGQGYQPGCTNYQTGAIYDVYSFNPNTGSDQQTLRFSFNANIPLPSQYINSYIRDIIVILRTTSGKYLLQVKSGPVSSYNNTNNPVGALYDDSTYVIQFSSTGIFEEVAGPFFEENLHMFMLNNKIYLKRFTSSVYGPQVGSSIQPEFCELKCSQVGSYYLDNSTTITENIGKGGVTKIPAFTKQSTNTTDLCQICGNSC